MISGHLFTESESVLEFCGELENGLFTGTVESAIQPAFLDLFERFEDAVSGQMFSLLDESDVDLERTNWLVEVDGSPPVSAYDVQIYPKEKRLSFRVK
jgi:hypothetical protein